MIFLPRNDYSSQEKCKTLIETELLKNASSIGARTINGIGMLVHQAALQYTLWTQKDAPLEIMQSAVIQRISG